MRNNIIYIGVLLFGISCNQQKKEIFDVDKQLEYCLAQTTKTLGLIANDSAQIPRNVLNGNQDWTLVDYKDWTSGFWPGTLWYLFEYTADEKWRNEALKYTSYLKPLSVESANDHDLGFQVFNSFGNGYRLTKEEGYKEVILMTADTLGTLFNPNVGTILSWPREVPNMEWPQHNTIMDNMINLELMFWASKNGGNSNLYDMAVSHADKTMQNHFREDFSSYHVVVYDASKGEKIKGVTHQGYADDSMWSRGQAWAIYGFTMVYRETGDEKYLDLVTKVTDVYLERLPKDLIPYWDFDAPNIPDEPRDASAASIVASALLELSALMEDSELSKKYRQKAEDMLQELSTGYQSQEENTAFLIHSTGHYPAESEIDASIIYSDYYYIEALMRLKKLRKGEPLIAYNSSSY